MTRLAPLLLFLLLAGCADWGYYHQSASGHWNLLQRRQPMTQLIGDDATPAGLRDHLRTLLAIRAFASTELALPDNDSYRSWADLGRPYVVWNLVATPEFSLEPRQWCFPVAGCVPYRGFFSRDDAEAYARTLRQQGDDVRVYGVPAYSTLRWFDDPVLNTFGLRSPEDVAGLIFHELAHQRLYLPGDAAFNEAFATAVEQEGVLRWHERHSPAGARDDYLRRRQREEAFVRLLLRAREDLAGLYGQHLPWREKRAEKQLRLQRLRQDIVSFRRDWGGFPGFDGWLDRGLNNASLATVGTYHGDVEGFRSLLHRLGGDFSAFHTAVGHLAATGFGERHQQLTELARAGTAPPPHGGP